MNTPLTWFITGASRGFGMEIARAALRRGDCVAATSRSPEAAAKAIGGGDQPAISSERLGRDVSDRLLTVAMDLASESSIAAAVEAAIGRFGRIDVLVNNAGHGIVGAVEESSDDEVRAVFEVNFYGLLRVTRAVLPHFRRRRSGHVVNLSSIAGISGSAGFGIYNATKFAVEGLSEALAKEVEPLGIRVTLVEPGPFRTDFLSDTSILPIARRIDDYDPTAGGARTYAVERHGQQAGDPVRGAEAIIQAVASATPPLHLVLGKMAVDRTIEKIEALRADVEAWRQVSLGTMYEE